eukprot:2030436-Amphidinium_carterae.2
MQLWPNLWVQQKVQENEIRVDKIAGKDNWTDVLTKAMDGQVLARHMDDSESWKSSTSTSI